MMTSRKSPTRAAVAVTLAVSAAALTAATAATANAAPAAPGESITTDILPGVRYTGNLTDGSTRLDTAFGSLTTQGANFQVQDATGATIAGQPLADAPLAVQDSHTAPEPNLAATVSGTGVNPVAGDVAASDYAAALGLVAGQFGLASGVGGMAGTVIGGIGGCAAGAFTGGSLFIPVSLGTLTLPAALAGCAGGAALGIAIGGATGAALVGIPVGIASLIQAYNIMNAPHPTQVSADVVPQA